MPAIVLAAVLSAAVRADTLQVVVTGDTFTRATPTLAKGTGLVMGRTIDPAGARPVPGVIVTLRTAPDIALSVLTDVAPNEWLDPEFLRPLVGSAVKVTLAEGEKKTQDIRIAK